MFYKDFTNPIELVFTLKVGTRNSNIKTWLPVLLMVSSSKLQKNLGFIPALRDFTLGTNLTLVYSQVDIPADELAARQKLDPSATATRPLYNQSPYIANGFLQYINRKSGTSANVSYNVQGPRLKVVSLIGTPDVFEQPFHALDFKISQQLVKGFSASFTVNNILDSQYRETQTYRDVDYIFQGRSPGRAFAVGLSYNLGAN
ncbi:MAG: TonB-dependent receptor [Saprospirales bacterium]|nr:TonB-dependent receptor [Saprospirales bacterium]